MIARVIRKSPEIYSGFFLHECWFLPKQTARLSLSRLFVLMLDMRGNGRNCSEDHAPIIGETGSKDRIRNEIHRENKVSKGTHDYALCPRRSFTVPHAMI